MSEIQQASQDIQILAARLRPILSLAELLEKIGNLEEASRSAHQHAAEAAISEGKAREALTKTEGQLGECQRAIEEANRTADRIREAAQEQADATRANGQQDADGIVAQANARKVEIEAAIDRLIEAKNGVQQELETKRNELAAITGEIASTKAKIAQLSG